MRSVAVSVVGGGLEEVFQESKWETRVRLSKPMVD
jgi:hypothetical protein